MNDKLIRPTKDEIDDVLSTIVIKLDSKELYVFLSAILQMKENERLNNIINELEKDFERKIQSCTIEAETTTNDFYCRLHIATLKKWLNKIQELKGNDK